MKKSLRILIVEACDFQRLKIEKMLNHLGCHRIAPIASLEQLFTYIRYAYLPFDIVLINYQIAIQEGVDIHEYCSGKASIKNFMIYRSSELSNLISAPLCDQTDMLLPPEGLNIETLQRLLSKITSRDSECDANRAGR